MMFLGVIFFMVDAHNDGDVRIIRRGGYNDFFDPGLEMGRCLFFVPEKTRALKDDFCPVLSPGNVGRIPFRIDLNLFPIDQQRMIRV